jgi:hypothetical protein
MDSIPAETLESILKHLLVYQHPLTERFATITDDSRKDILNARLVCRGFCESKPMQDAFVKVLEDTPLFCKGFQMDRMQGVSGSNYSGKMTVMTLPAFFTRYPDNNINVRDGMYSLLTHFPHVKHLRLRYTDDKLVEDQDPLDPKELLYSTGSCIDGLARRESHARIGRGHIDTILIYCRLALTLEGLEFPLKGLCAWSCTMKPSDFKIIPRFSSLKHLSINLAYHRPSPLLESWLPSLRNLEFLDIALSRSIEENYPTIGTKLRMLPRATARDQLTKHLNLKTFRLRASFDCSFDAEQILEATHYFPGLENLGLSHVLLDGDDPTTWSSLLKELEPRKIKLVQLIFPGYRRNVFEFIRDDGLGEGDIRCESKLITGIQWKQFASGVQVIPIQQKEFGNRVLAFHVFDE